MTILAATPVLCFGAVSGLAAWLSRRLGEERVLFGALILLSAGRPEMLPAGGLAGSSSGHPEADSTPADNYSKLLNCASFHGVSAWMRGG